MWEPSHDDDGNMTATGDGWSYAWNGENRLILVSNETVLVTYAYDHRGRMTWKTVSSENASSTKTIQYVWDDFNIIAETIAANSATNVTYNIWGLDLDGTLQGVGGVGGLLAVVKDTATYIPAWDANGNISEYVSADGTIAAHREYDPFGCTVVYTAQSAITNQQSEITNQQSEISFSHWFSTKPWCSVTGLSEYQYRKYSPVTGRWLSRDPIGEDSGSYLFVFVRNSSLNHVDAFGLQTLDPSWPFDPGTAVNPLTTSGSSLEPPRKPEGCDKPCSCTKPDGSLGTLRCKYVNSEYTISGSQRNADTHHIHKDQHPDNEDRSRKPECWNPAYCFVDPKCDEGWTPHSLRLYMTFGGQELTRDRGYDHDNQGRRCFEMKTREWMFPIFRPKMKLGGWCTKCE